MSYSENTAGLKLLLDFFFPSDACELTLDPNTAHRNLILSADNREVTRGSEQQPYPDHPERFDGCFQVLCREGLSDRCYWEVEWAGRISVAVTYRGISRRGKADDCSFGWDENAWVLECTDDGYACWHNNTPVEICLHQNSSVSGLACWHSVLLQRLF